MNMKPILLAICTDIGFLMQYCSCTFNNFCGCLDKPDDDEWLNCSIVKLKQLQSSTLRVSLQYAMLCGNPLSSSSSCDSTDNISCDSTDNISCVSTDDVSGVSANKVSDVSTDNVSGVSTGDASGAGVSTDDISGVSTDNVSGAGVSTDDISGVSTDDVSSCVSVQNALLCT